MRTSILLAVLGAVIAVSAASSVSAEPRHGRYHHRHQVCSFRHHHRVCHWAG